MNVLKKIASILMVGVLCACSDDSNDDLVAAINAQNEILAQGTTTAVRGRVINAIDDSDVTSAEITIKLGSQTLVDSVATDGASFEIADLPSQSDLELIVSSPNDAFMPRVYYFSTGDSGSSVVNVDLGTIAVSESVVVSIPVLDSISHLAIEGLAFEGYSHIGEGSSYVAYKYESVFNATTGQYEIELPKYISTTVYAPVDIDGDGDDDYEIDSYAYDSYDNDTGLYSIYISNANRDDFDTVELTALPEEFPSVEFRVSILDSSLNQITSGNFYISDSENDNIISSYDSTAEQHVATAVYDDYLTIDIPATEFDGVDYQSASISVRTSSDGSIQFNSNNAASYFYFNRSEASSYDLALQLNEIGVSSQLEVLLDSVDAETNIYTVFYSEPIEVDEASINFVSVDAITVVRGDDSGSDAVLPGTTYLRVGEDVDVDVSLDHNGTRLVVSPVLALEELSSYEVSVDYVTVTASDELANASGDYESFTTVGDSSLVFDINDISLDNINYYSNGSILQATNTAGVASTRSESDGSVYVYFPDSIATLESFSIAMVSYVEDGVSYPEYDYMNIVEYGNVQVNRNYMLDAAYNEIVDVDSYLNYYRGSTKADGYYYRDYIGESMGDDTGANENTVTFTYSYVTSDGNIYTGDLTLPVK